MGWLRRYDAVRLGGGKASSPHCRQSPPLSSRYWGSLGSSSSLSLGWKMGEERKGKIFHPAFLLPTKLGTPQPLLFFWFPYLQRLECSKVAEVFHCFSVNLEGLIVAVGPVHDSILAHRVILQLQLTERQEKSYPTQKSTFRYY